MSKILIFFRHDHFEIWSIDANNRLIPLDFLDSNIVPLYFLISGTDISLGKFANEQYEKGIGESLGQFWDQIATSNEKIIRGTSILPKRELLATAFIEVLLPDLSRNYFHNKSVESILQSQKVIVCFEPFCSEEKEEEIFELLKGKLFNSPNIVHLDFWNALFSFYNSKALLNADEKHVAIASYNSDLYCFLIEERIQKDRYILEGKGIDPRLNAISDFCIEKIKARGSLVDAREIRAYIKKDVSIILESLSKGLVEHVFNNPRLGVAKFTFSIHQSVLSSRLDNPSEFLFLETEIFSFRKRNDCENTKLVFLTSSINQPIFFKRFESVGTIGEPKNFNEDFKIFLCNQFETLLKSEPQKPTEGSAPPIRPPRPTSGTAIPQSSPQGPAKPPSVPATPKKTHPSGLIKPPSRPASPPKTPQGTPKPPPPGQPKPPPPGPPKPPPPGPPKAPPGPPNTPPKKP
jgi:hypothetical protein